MSGCFSWGHHTKLRLLTLGFGAGCLISSKRIIMKLVVKHISTKNPKFGVLRQPSITHESGAVLEHESAFMNFGEVDCPPVGTEFTFPELVIVDGWWKIKGA